MLLTYLFLSILAPEITQKLPHKLTVLAVSHSNAETIINKPKLPKLKKHINEYMFELMAHNKSIITVNGHAFENKLLIRSLKPS